MNKDPLFTNLGPDREAPPIGKARVPCAVGCARLHTLCSCAFARASLSWMQVLGVNAFGSVKHDFYGLLCMRRAPKKEGLFNELRGLVTRMNRALPGAERKCVPLHSPACTKPRYEFAHSFL